jgi:kinesin family protein 13
VFITCSQSFSRTFVNGKDVKERTLLKHGDRILWGNNHFFRINCPRLPGSEIQPEQQPVDFLSAQQELMMNQLVQGKLNGTLDGWWKSNENEKGIIENRFKNSFIPFSIKHYQS